MSNVLDMPQLRKRQKDLVLAMPQLGTGQEDTIGESDVARQTTGSLQGPLSEYQVEAEIGKAKIAAGGAEAAAPPGSPYYIDLDNLSEKDAKFYAFAIGAADTYRGLKQLTGIGEDEAPESDRQAVLRHMKRKYPSINKYHLGGMIGDPATFLLPAAKAKTAWNMAKYGAVTGSIAGATGYIDEDIPSLINPDEPMTRPEMALMGTVGGTLLAPLFGKGGQYLAEKYKPRGEQLWKTMSKNPAYGMGAAGGLYGFASSPEEDFTNRLKTAMGWALVGASAGAAANLSPIKEKLGKIFIAEYGLPEQYLNQKVVSAKNRNVAQREFDDVTTQLHDLDEPTRKAMFRVLNDMEDRDMALASLTSDQVKLYQDAEDVITKFGKELVDVGALDMDTWLKNVGSYMHRSYTKEGSAPRLTGVSRQTINTMGDALRMRGHVKKIPADEWEVDKFHYLGTPDESAPFVQQRVNLKTGEVIPPEKYADFPEEAYRVHNVSQRGPVSKGGWEVVGQKESPDGSVTVRRDWTEKEQRDMGLMEDVALAFNQTGRVMSNDLAAYKFYAEVAGSFGRRLGPDEPIPKGWSWVEPTRIGMKGRERYGDLAGMVIPDNIYHDIVTMDKWRRVGGQKRGAIATIAGQDVFPGIDKVINGYRSLNRWWKTTKTALNAPVHVGNVLSNVMMYDMHNGSLKAFRAGRKSMQNKDARFKLAEDWDVFSGTMVSAELMAKNRHLYDAYALDGGAGTLEKLINNAPVIAQKVAKGAKWGKEQTYDRALQLYQFEDYIFRMGLFNSRITQGIEEGLQASGLKRGTKKWNEELAALEKTPPQDVLTKAAREAKEGFVDYGKNSPFVYAMRETAIPFIAYTWGMIPRLAETAVKKPWKVAKWSAILGGMNAIGEDLSGEPAKTKKERAMMSEHQQTEFLNVPGGASTRVKLPKQISPFSKGTSAYLDMARWVPGGQPFGTEEGEQLGRIPGVPPAMSPSFGAAGSIYRGAMGVEGFTGKEIPTWQDRAKSVGQQFIPNLPIPPEAYGGHGPDSFSYAGEKMSRGLQEGGFHSPTKDEQTLTSAVLQSLGVRVTPIDLRKLRQRKQYSTLKKLEVIKDKASKLNRQKAEKRWDSPEGRAEYKRRMAELKAEAKALGKTMNKELKTSPKDMYETLWDKVPAGLLP